MLKKVIIASGNKVAIGDTYADALKKLASTGAVNIEVENTDDINDLIQAIIKANNNLKSSTQSSDWEQIGRDTKKLQELISRMEQVKNEKDKKTEENTNTEITNEINQ